jgi:hypothetical protein
VGGRSASRLPHSHRDVRDRQDPVDPSAVRFGCSVPPFAHRVGRTDFPPPIPAPSSNACVRRTLPPPWKRRCRSKGSDDPTRSEAIRRRQRRSALRLSSSHSACRMCLGKRRRSDAART